MGGWEVAWVDMVARMEALTVAACMVVDMVTLIVAMAAAMVEDLAAAMVACTIDMGVEGMVNMEGGVMVE
jgi:hypothetical protein